MKHGDKAKSKAASKTSVKKSKSSKASASGKAGAKSSKARKASLVKSQKHQAPGKAAKQTSGGSKAHAAPGNGKPGRLPTDNAGFTNPTVAAAFKRAVKKYPNAFRRLTD